MPWRLRSRGVVLVTFHWVETRRARAFVPPGMRILSLRPGRTVGALFLANYGPGSDLEYSELIASAATVLYRARPAAWVAALLVDQPASVIGGRELLGAPKYFAPFTRTAGARQGVTVGTQEDPICGIEYDRPHWLWHQRIRIAALHRDVRDGPGAPASSAPLSATLSTEGPGAAALAPDALVVAHASELRGRIGWTRAAVNIPATSPLSPLGLGAPFLTLAGRDVDLVLGQAAEPVRCDRPSASPRPPPQDREQPRPLPTPREAPARSPSA